jgi:endonuclease/exonuclease/phosphatase family metal-dependent hydrolase
MNESRFHEILRGRAGKVLRVVCWILLGLGLLILGLLLLVWSLTYHPKPMEPVPVKNRPDAPLLSRSQPFTVMNWNVQYMAGKNYVFFYDLLDGSGPDVRPRREDLDATTKEVARVIAQRRPDFILLQELDEGAKRSDGENQLKKLLALLPPEYGSFASAWYWKAAFVPHPKVWGRVGLKLAVISRHRLSAATRHQLPLMPDWWVVQQFNFKRAVLEVRVPLAEGGELALMTTHLDAFAQGTDTMERQVQAVRRLLGGQDDAGRPFILGGDFNLLPDRAAYDRLAPPQRAYYKPDTELATLGAGWSSVPAPEHTQGPDFARWFTHFPNDPRVSGPDRTIDYLFFSKALRVEAPAVLSEGTQRISDHLPIVATFRLP